MQTLMFSFEGIVSYFQDFFALVIMRSTYTVAVSTFIHQKNCQNDKRVKTAK